MINKPIKINDSSAGITIDSNADKYWKEHGLREFFPLLRPGLRLPSGLKGNNTEMIVKQYYLKGIGFGNWLSIEDRLNYSNALILAFYDLNKILRFDNNIGIRGNLTVTFGDRGIPRSLAHYRADRILININRYPRNKHFLTSGGVHSFSHEYGHFLDYFAGGVLERDKSIYSLSNGHSISRSKTNRTTPMRCIMDDILDTLIWQKQGTPTNYYKTIIENTGTKGIGEYWIRRTELFARTFEVYVKFELDELGIKNAFLTKLSYVTWAYPDTQLMKKIVPKMRELISLIRKKIN